MAKGPQREVSLTVATVSGEWKFVNAFQLFLCCLARELKDTFQVLKFSGVCLCA